LALPTYQYHDVKAVSAHISYTPLSSLLIVPFPNFDIFALLAQVHLSQKTLVSVTLHIFSKSYIIRIFLATTILIFSFSIVPDFFKYVNPAKMKGIYDLFEEYKEFQYIDKSSFTSLLLLWVLLTVLFINVNYTIVNKKIMNHIEKLCYV
jgi:hypothetical protein